MKAPYTVRTLRGANAVVADPDKRVSADGTRSALGRNQKCSIGAGRFTVVRCYTLKERVNNKWETKWIHRGNDEAIKWLEGGAI